MEMLQKFDVLLAFEIILLTVLLVYLFKVKYFIGKIQYSVSYFIVDSTHFLVK